MDFDFPPDDDPRRLAIRQWIASHPDATMAETAEAGFVVPHWPQPWGIEADPMHQLIIDEEFDRAQIHRPVGIGIGWAAPTILLAGTEAQKAEYLPRILSGEDQWCQLFSEPDAGSDLASLRTSAVRDGDTYVVNGSKIWTSGGHNSRYGILIARTDPSAPKHRGISYFICPMDLPGITLTPIIDMTTAHSFNQVFFDDVRLPADLLVGVENDGWRLTKATLSNERVMLSSAGSLWGAGPSAADLINLVRADGGQEDPLLRQRLARLHCESEVLRLNRLRTLSARLKGRTLAQRPRSRRRWQMNTVSTSWSWPRISSGLTGCLRAPARWAQCPRTRAPARQRSGSEDTSSPASTRSGTTGSSSPRP